jgi:hypothetical protein
LLEPNADEKERAMGFPTRVTSVLPISEASCQQVLGQAMDLNYLTWIVSLGMAKHRWLKATSIVVTPLVSSLPMVMVEASAGGEESCTFHLWSTWDGLGMHVEVVTHVVGGVCCFNGVPLLTWRSMRLLPRFLRNNPWCHPLLLVCLPRRLGSH